MQTRGYTLLPNQKRRNKSIPSIPIKSATLSLANLQNKIAKSVLKEVRFGGCLLSKEQTIVRTNNLDTRAAHYIYI